MVFERTKIRIFFDLYKQKALLIIYNNAGHTGYNLLILFVPLQRFNEK